MNLCEIILAASPSDLWASAAPVRALVAALREVWGAASVLTAADRVGPARARAACPVLSPAAAVLSSG